jgi:hypothetical protein
MESKRPTMRRKRKMRKRRKRKTINLMFNNNANLNPGQVSANRPSVSRAAASLTSSPN